MQQKFPHDLKQKNENNTWKKDLYTPKNHVNLRKK